MNKILNLIFVDWDDARIFDIKTLLFEETVDMDEVKKLFDTVCTEQTIGNPNYSNKSIMDEVKKQLVENKISTKSCETDNYAFYL